VILAGILFVIFLLTTFVCIIIDDIKRHKAASKTLVDDEKEFLQYSKYHLNKETADRKYKEFLNKKDEDTGETELIRKAVETYKASKK
jgi:hypothetical protein